MLDNLLSNALAHDCGDKPIALTLQDEQEQWCLSVCNCGKLIEAVRDRLFEPFVTGRSSGIGLGLATVKQVCTANGWRVQVETESDLVCFRIRGALQPERMLRTGASASRAMGEIDG